MQPDPIPNTHTPVVDSFIEQHHYGTVNRTEAMLLGLINITMLQGGDSRSVEQVLRERKQLGLERYGVALQPFNGRNARQDLLEELLDALIYAHQVRMEDEASYL